MDLIQAAWMVRELGQPVSAVDIDGSGNLIVGGWDGLLKKWNSDGDLIWSAECGDRIESILLHGNLVVVTAGLHIVCLENGSVIWERALEGSADMLTSKGGEIIATSSVYDIEHGDFMESAIWRFTESGDLLDVKRIDERPWFIAASKELIIGLGRPRCGVLIDDNHRDLAVKSPVTCGSTYNGIVLLGHADGSISDLDGAVLSTENSAISTILCAENSFTVGTEAGDIVSRNYQNDKIWFANGDSIVTQTTGFEGTHWCARWNGLSGLIEVRDNSEGEILASAVTSKPRVSHSTVNRVVFGFENGQVLVWERELFSRRLENPISIVNERKSDLASRLRSLRK